MMTRDSFSPPTVLTIVVLAKENTSYAFRNMMESLRAQTVAGLQTWVLDCNVPGDPYSLSLQEDVGGMEDVQLLSVHTHRGIAKACNEVLEQIQTPYVGFVNSCDSWYPYKAERQLQELEADPAVCACLCNGYRRLGKTAFADSSLIFTEAETEPARWLTSRQFALSSQVIYRAESLRAIGGYDACLEARLDQDALLRMCDGKTLKIIPEALFENTAVYVADAYVDYRSLRYLMDKHYDILLLNRRQYYATNMELARQACRCTLWVHAAIHFLVAIMKKPIQALSSAVTSGAKGISNALQRLWKLLRIRQEAAALRRRLRPLRSGETQLNPPVLLPERENMEEYQLDPARDNHPMAFAGNKTIRNAVIPNHMTLIPYGMFAGCKNLERVVIPASVTHIDAYAFLGCERLRQVEIASASQMTHIADYAFAGCSMLNALTLPCNINHMGAYAFAGCANLSEVRFAYNEQGRLTEKKLFPVVLDEIAPAVFAGCRSLQAVEFAEGVMLRAVGREAFLGCASLHHVYLDGRISGIGDYAFAGCTALESFAFPQIDAVAHIGRQAFYCCQSLTYFRLPFALKTITRSCFEGCDSLKYVKVPKNVLYIEPKAYVRCRDLERVMLTSTNTKYAPNAFEPHTQIEHS